MNRRLRWVAAVVLVVAWAAVVWRVYTTAPAPADAPWLQPGATDTAGSTVQSLGDALAGLAVWVLPLLVLVVQPLRGRLTEPIGEDE